MAVIKVSVRKTVQEEAYSPVVFELGVEVDVKSDNEKVIEVSHKHWADELQVTMDEIILKRLEESK
jgi:hypothetical protein